tara:strand:- start:1142 stop:1303 length:162 start_codon:yes stop_codon:yes gene_type:complete
MDGSLEKLNQVGEEEGWTESTKIALACEYIDNALDSLPGQWSFVNFLERKKAE